MVNPPETIANALTGRSRSQGSNRIQPSENDQVHLDHFRSSGGVSARMPLSPPDSKGSVTRYLPENITTKNWRVSLS